MNERISIRPFLPADPVSAITALLHAAYASLAKMGFRYLATHQDDVTTLCRLQRGFPFVAEMDGVIIATITLRSPVAQSECSWYCQQGVYSFGQFAVRPDLQKRGIGLRLIQFVEDRAREQGAEELSLDTAEGALHLRQWYERLGFRQIVGCVQTGCEKQLGDDGHDVAT